MQLSQSNYVTVQYIDLLSHKVRKSCDAGRRTRDQEWSWLHPSGSCYQSWQASNGLYRSSVLARTSLYRLGAPPCPPPSPPIDACTQQPARIFWCFVGKMLTHYYCALLSHRFSGKTPVEEIVATMKEYVEYVNALEVFPLFPPTPPPKKNKRRWLTNLFLRPLPFI